MLQSDKRRPVLEHERVAAAGCRGSLGSEAVPGIVELNWPFLLRILQSVATSVILRKLGQLAKQITLIIREKRKEAMMLLFCGSHFYPVCRNHRFKRDRCASNLIRQLS